ncbi:hypothetical protein QOT17_005465 [Balamuthia mandrillaris]
MSSKELPDRAVHGVYPISVVAVVRCLGASQFGDRGFVALGSGLEDLVHFHKELSVPNLQAFGFASLPEVYGRLDELENFLNGPEVVAKRQMDQRSCATATIGKKAVLHNYALIAFFFTHQKSIKPAYGYKNESKVARVAACGKPDISRIVTKTKKMGNAHCLVHNDTPEPAVVITYNYSDCVNVVPFRMYIVKPNETREVKAAADFRGLKLRLQLEDDKSGVYMAANNDEVLVSVIGKMTGGRIRLEHVKAGIEVAGSGLVKFVEAGGAFVGAFMQAKK